MNELGQNVSLFCTEGPGDYEPDLNFLENHSDILKLYNDSIKKVTNGSLVASRNLYPPRVNDLFSRINMLHAYPPQGVTKLLNRS